VTLAHWDEIEAARRDFGVLRGSWRVLGDAAGSVGVGLRRIELARGEVPTPAHRHLSTEEIFFVLAGSGLSWQDGTTYEIRAGDSIVHPARGAAHTLRAGDDGLDVLVFGERDRVEGIHLPNSSTAWLLPTWVDAGTGEHPYAREPELDWPLPSPRPATIVNLHELEGEYGGIVKHPGREAGATRTGLNWAALPASEEGAPPHCHSAEEELFVILDGEGVLELWGRPDPTKPLQTEPAETYPIRRGHVISRPAGTRISHSLRAGPAGLTYLAYGTREPNDIAWYPRSNKVFFRGLGVIGRLDLLDYHDGERG
jgi:uncharacterized cupin superfamily protein